MYLMRIYRIEQTGPYHTIAKFAFFAFIGLFRQFPPQTMAFQ